jgi:hypothetical protein
VVLLSKALLPYLVLSNWTVASWRKKRAVSLLTAAKDRCFIFRVFIVVEITLIQWFQKEHGHNEQNEVTYDRQEVVLNGIRDQ